MRTHLGLEELERRPALGLGTVEREIGILQELVGVVAIGRARAMPMLTLTMTRWPSIS
jgi:hypothetical protein